MRVTPSRDCKKDLRDEHGDVMQEKTYPLHILPKTSKAIVLDLLCEAPSKA
jgi:hypothetical protein